MVMPSTPGAPLFPFTCFHAALRFSGDRTRSSRLSLKAGSCSLPPADNFTFGTCCAVAEAGQTPRLWLPASPYLLHPWSRPWLMFRPSPGFITYGSRLLCRSGSAGQTFGQTGLQFRHGQRPAVKIPLGELAAVTLQKIALNLRFHPLGHDL